MCDTMCKIADWSHDGITYFAKNSDRSPNEPLLTIHIPAKHHDARSFVKCTYIEIPQVEYTREMILFKPSWIWGAEMGINESRVIIGNEAVFTKSKKQTVSLIGMDLLRLALERGDSAIAAIEVMIQLLETYGQGGNCGFDHEFYYDNSFLAADPKEAYIMETSGKNYAVKKIKDKNAISNRLSIGKDHFLRSSSVKPNDDFAKRFTEPVYSFFAAARQRRGCAMAQLSASGGAAALIEILRSHNPNLKGKEFTRGSVSSICMHGGGLIGDHTTGCVVAVLRPEKPVTLWCNGTSTPCISAFKPVFWQSADPSVSSPAQRITPINSPPVFTDPAQSLSYWLKREHIHRAIIAGKIDAASLRSKIKELEKDWLQREEKIMSYDNPEIDSLIKLAKEAAEKEQQLIDEIYTDEWRDIGTKGRYRKYWDAKNKVLGAAKG